jgi:spore maturation protein CgeB
LNVKPDLIIINAGGEVSPKTLQELRKKTKAMIVCWAGDDPNTYNIGPYYKEGTKYYDHYFLVDPSWYTEQFRLSGVKKCSILQYGVDPTVYKPLQLSNKECEKYGADLCHLGTLHTERKELLMQLLDYDLAIWGAVSLRFLKNYSGISKTLMPFIRSGVIPAEISNKIYNASKISLNIQHSQVSSAHNNKTFEIAASGAFLLTSYCDAESKSFTKDELICFKNVKELRQLIDYYLKNDSERCAIAQKAYQRTITSHLYTHRLQQLLSECGL